MYTHELMHAYVQKRKKYTPTALRVGTLVLFINHVHNEHAHSRHLIEQVGVSPPKWMYTVRISYIVCARQLQAHAQATGKRKAGSY